MDDVIKWYFIFIICLFGSLYGYFAYSDHVKSECRISAMQNHISVADIDKVCN